MTSPVRPARPDDPLKDAMLLALQRILEPLLDMMFDVGVTVQELNKLARDRATHIANARVMKQSGRPSKSRVAIMTGLPRAEVTRILASTTAAKKSKPEQHPIRRLLAAWHDQPRFLTPDGDPAVLPIFGPRLSFERLANRYGAGIPVRAMLDELLQVNAVELLDGQRVKAKTRIPVMTGLTTRSISAMGERGRDLLQTLAHNARQGSPPLFEATAAIEQSDFEMLSLIRREITIQGTNFIQTAGSLLGRSRIKRNSKTIRPKRECRLGVTVYYFQDEVMSSDVNAVVRHRKNLRRSETR